MTYDISITRITDTDSPASESTLMLTEIFGQSPSRDRDMYWTTTDEDAEQIVREHWALNDWDLDASYPHGFVAEWVEVAA